MAEMKATGQTSIQEPRRFAAGAGTDKSRGRDNGDGTYTLYTRANVSETGFRNFFGMLDARRDAARIAIEMVFKRVNVESNIGNS